MSQPTPLTITPNHYQALCGLALAALFLVQMQQNIHLVVNLLTLFIGTVGILYRVRLSPILVLLAIGVAHLFAQYNLNQFFNPDFRSFRSFEVADVLLCTATLVFLIGQYRLHGLWFGVLPSDAHQAAAARGRSAQTLHAGELAALVFTIPVFALLAQFACLLLKQHWTLIDLPPRWKQFLAVAWALLLVMFLAAHGFRYWRRLRMDRATALLLMQDILWNETRGEQRRINRWIVWRTLKDRKNAE